MEDEAKSARRGKPQQPLYRPGGGGLYKKTPDEQPRKSHPKPRGGRAGSRPAEDAPENGTPTATSDGDRQRSEPRRHLNRRNRDSRSIDGGKPPSGRRNSAAPASSEPGPKQAWTNPESMPPRFRKKLETERRPVPVTMHSQTLPHRRTPLNHESESDSRSSTPHQGTETSTHANLLMEKLTGQSLPPPIRSLPKIQDHAVSVNPSESVRLNGSTIPPFIKSNHLTNGQFSAFKDTVPHPKPATKFFPNPSSPNADRPSNRLLESIAMCDRPSPSVDPVRPSNRAPEVKSGSENNHSSETAARKKEGENDPSQTSNVRQDPKQGRSSGGRQSERKSRDGKSGKKNKKRASGVKKNNAANRRSSSRSSQKRERSVDNTRQRNDRSPQSQNRNRDLRDHLRDNKENVGHKDVKDFHEKESSRDRRHFHRKEHSESNRLTSQQLSRSTYSRENSRERRCFSRNTSSDRGGFGSRPNSRDRNLHHIPEKINSQRDPPQRVMIDPEKIKLPPPPPPIMNPRNSRNHNRRDSWSGRGSRHASIESGPGESAYSPPRGPGGGGGGGGGGWRRRRRDSDTRHSTSSNSNWREEMPLHQDRHETESRRGNKSDSISSAISERRHEGGTGKATTPGIIILPSDSSDKIRNKSSSGNSHNSNNNNRGSSVPVSQNSTGNRILYDWHNPNKPILVPQTTPSSSRLQDNASLQISDFQGRGFPSYYDRNSESFKSCHNRPLLLRIQDADAQLKSIMESGCLLRDWDMIQNIRPFLQHSLQILLGTDLKFCQTEHVDHDFWKMLYYNIIDKLRKLMVQEEQHKNEYISLINSIIKDGNAYYENLLELLQTTYKFQLDDYLNAQYISPPKGLGFIGLALIAAQNIYIFLGDLARYKELVNDTSNYAKSKNWYTKANQINPKNGRPYNQLAILAVYGRRKLDAVYFYMRSLMSSNPFYSARESLIGLFDDNRKKYEASERKRLAERQKVIEVIGGARGLRREIWTKASGGRTTTLLQADRLAARAALSDDEELASMSSVDLNKKFITTYLHVHGKLITKIGMETLSESATTMLRQFRALLRHSPLPINSGRLLQLTALNMFAIEAAQLKEPTSAIVGGGCRSEVQERALAVSLRMFGALLARCCALLSAPLEGPNQKLAVHDDVIVILPAIKVWCEWMLAHSSVWNPPPACDDFDVGGDSDPWPKLAKLMNLLEPVDLQRSLLKSEPSEDHEIVRLPEDSQLAGFTPLMSCVLETIYAPKSLDPESAKLAVRTRRLLFFGTEFLCGLDPPALESRFVAPDRAEYVSVVRRRQPEDDLDRLRDRRDSSGDSDIMEASMSEEEEAVAPAEPVPEVKLSWAAEDSNDETTKMLLKRRGQLENRRRDQERRRLRMQSLLRKGQISVEIEVRPRYLVPDTNCFIDHLSRLQRLLAPDANTSYIIVVPLVVVSELQGLTKAPGLGEAARRALDVLHVRRTTLKFATTKGNLLSTATFTAEQDGDAATTNDDRILTASLNLCRAEAEESSGAVESCDSESSGARRLVREVVLLTDDRNLRVKAIARDLPVRDLPGFMRWAAIE